MRVLLLSKANIVGIYQRKLEYIAQRGVELLAIVPPSWKDERGEQLLERTYTTGYTLKTLPLRFNGSFHLHHYHALGRTIAAFQPDIVHIDEEPYNLATWQALMAARRSRAKAVFFSWQNIVRRYPVPFSWGERWVLRTIDYAIVGTESAGAVWRAKGYHGRMAVIPQFGVDTSLFRPSSHRPARPFTIGYVGRLVEEKGVQLLLEASRQLEGDWQMRIVGGGPQREHLAAQADALGIAGRVTFVPQRPSTAMPDEYTALDVLVLPSLTRPNWKEQFGRVLIEAMASGVVVIGSDSGAIPDVIGNAGLIFPEGNVQALAACLQRLQRDVDERQALRAVGLARVHEQFTHESIAAHTTEVYDALMQQKY